MLATNGTKEIYSFLILMGLPDALLLVPRGNDRTTQNFHQNRTENPEEHLSEIGRYEKRQRSLDENSESWI